MRTFQFKSHNIKKGLIFGFGYLIVVFLVLCIVFDGVNGLADTINNFGSAKGLGLLVAVVVIGPLVILLQYINPKVDILIDNDYLHIRQAKRNDQIIALAVIDRMEINQKLVNQLQLFDQNKQLLANIHPQSDTTVIFLIANAISQQEKLKHSKGNKKIFGNTIETVSYYRHEPR